jgi:hypothetical protein
MDDQGHVVAAPERVEKGIQVLLMTDERVSVRFPGRKLAGVTHPDQIRRDAPTEIPDVGHDIAPQVR